MLILIIVLVLVFGLGGGYYGYGRWGTGGGAGIGLGTILVICLLAYFLGFSDRGFVQLPGIADRLTPRALFMKKPTCETVVSAMSARAS